VTFLVIDKQRFAYFSRLAPPKAPTQSRSRQGSGRVFGPYAIYNAQFHYQNEKELQQGIAPRPPREVHGPVGDHLLSMQIDFPDTTGVTIARPKSRIFACPRFVTKIFAGLMSL
jgi:hypothetical protein